MESELSVNDIMTTEYIAVSESDTVLGAVRLMREERVGCVLVVRGSDPVGIMTEWDVLGLIDEEASPADTLVESVMSSPVLTIDATRSLTDATNTMARERIRNLVVEGGGEVLGLLTQRDVITAAASFQGTTTPDAPAEELVAAPNSETEPEPLANGGDQYSGQGVCEACGSLTDALWESNGRLLCPDCRAV